MCTCTKLKSICSCRDSEDAATSPATEPRCTQVVPPPAGMGRPGDEAQLAQVCWTHGADSGLPFLVGVPEGSLDPGHGPLQVLGREDLGEGSSAHLKIHVTATCIPQT